ncbi:xanthine dehydrogenase family protein subunit M [Bradyrhizobium prioriisuperbiae]|uniref:FAD binding domain-containing protein n=1 Tax=Bradyrhizobium prioriisuperbiae TaxID=2854389 RepID=UPI0028F0ECEB|nr:xanthine dehydrogenase family protein subunit M [Bradyrhizobium prioritasuperba]
MKPAPFKYIVAHSVEEAVALKVEHGSDACFLAGGQSLVPALNFRLAQPAVLIDINTVADCDGVSVRDGKVSVGALTRYRVLQRNPGIAQHAPLIAEALPHIAHPQVRNRGTIGGNLSHADPASELPAIMLASGARMRVRSSAGERWIDARMFFVGALCTALEAHEMLVEVELPATAPRCGTAFMEIARRRGDFAIMGIAATLTLADDGSCAAARLAYCGAGDGPVLAAAAASILIGGRVGENDIAAAAEEAAREVDPFGSIHASKDYQRHLAGVLTRRALNIAIERARMTPASVERIGAQ